MAYWDTAFGDQQLRALQSAGAQAQLVQCLVDDFSCADGFEAAACQTVLRRLFAPKKPNSRLEELVFVESVEQAGLPHIVAELVRDASERLQRKAAPAADKREVATFNVLMLGRAFTVTTGLTGTCADVLAQIGREQDLACAGAGTLMDASGKPYERECRLRDLDPGAVLLLDVGHECPFCSHVPFSISGGCSMCRVHRLKAMETLAKQARIRFGALGVGTTCAGAAPHAGPRAARARASSQCAVTNSV